MRSGALWGSWPYFAFGICALGILLQYLLSRRQMDAIHQKLSATWAVFGGSRLWKVSFASLLAGHLAGLLFPRQILLWNRVPARLYLLESIAFGIGAVALFCGVRLAWRHLGTTSGPVIREVADMALLGLLLVAFLSGVLTAVFYHWGSSWGTATLSPYFLTLLRGSPAVKLAAQMPFLVQLHVFSFFAALAVLPFSRMALVLVFGLDRLCRLVARPIAGIFDGLEVRVRRLNLAARIWPEED